jgi:hypothetical protein
MATGSTNHNYPSSIDTFATYQDDVDSITAISVNDCHTSILAVENELGTNPKGSASTLKARLAVSINDDGTLKDSVQGATGVGIQGATGIGVQGNTGLSIQGETGVGVQGNTGLSIQGATGVGIQGDTGLGGAQGNTGLSIQGETGVAGQHALNSTVYHVSSATTGVFFKADTNSLPIGATFLFENGTGVGIGTTTPASKLDIYGTNSTLRFTRDTGDRYGQIFYDGGSFIIRQPYNDALDIQNYLGTSLLYVAATGKVGIGTSNPLDVLQLQGNVAIGSTDNVSPGILKFLSTSGGQSASIRNPQATSRAMQFNTTAFAMMIDSSGNVGIGTTTPQDLLHVQGNTRTTTLIVSKASGEGIKVDTITPTFGWRDLTGLVTIRGIGSTDPSFNVFRNNIRQQQFSVNDECFLEFHMPHDYAPGTDIYIHPHWSHNSAVVTGGSVTWTCESTYSKGHNQAAFPASVLIDCTQNASTTQYQHMVSESQASTAGGGAALLNTTNLEVDGVILVRVYLKTNAITVSGGGVPEPFLHFVDIHYQSSNISTKAKAPNFYT